MSVMLTMEDVNMSVPILMVTITVPAIVDINSLKMMTSIVLVCKLHSHVMINWFRVHGYLFYMDVVSLIKIIMPTHQ